MADLSVNARNSVALQHEMFRLAKLEHGLSIGVLHQRTRISKSTLTCWASGETQMPAWALGELGIPDELASLVLDPWQKQVRSGGIDETDLDDLATAAMDFAAKYQRARHPESPAGIHIAHTEQAELRKDARKLKSKAGKVAQ